MSTIATAKTLRKSLRFCMGRPRTCSREQVRNSPTSKKGGDRAPASQPAARSIYPGTLLRSSLVARSSTLPARFLRADASSPTLHRRRFIANASSRTLHRGRFIADATSRTLHRGRFIADASSRTLHRRRFIADASSPTLHRRAHTRSARGVLSGKVADPLLMAAAHLRTQAAAGEAVGFLVDGASSPRLPRRRCFIATASSSTALPRRRRFIVDGASSPRLHRHGFRASSPRLHRHGCPSFIATAVRSSLPELHCPSFIARASSPRTYLFGTRRLVRKSG